MPPNKQYFSRRTIDQENSIIIAKMEERLENLEEKINDLHKALDEIRKSIDEINSASARVKGGIFVVLLIGGFVGWLTTLGSTIAKVWPFK
jgi:hypothetical protein